MKRSIRALTFALAAALAVVPAIPSLAQDKAQDKPAEATAKKPFKPYYGMPGRDAVWVPTPYELIEKMLDMAKVTPSDLVMDLGSGDGRNVIAAGKRGARGIGVEYNNDLVELSREIAKKEGVADKVTFIQGDMYKADISKASVLALFLLPEHMDKMVNMFLNMRPGSRIVVNGFRMSHWDVDETGSVGGECKIWCTAFLYIVPAKVEGTWSLSGGGELTLQQRFQKFTGTLTRDGKRMGNRQRRDARRGDQLHLRRRAIHRHGGWRPHQGHNQGRRCLGGDPEIAGIAPHPIAIPTARVPGARAVSLSSIERPDQPRSRAHNSRSRLAARQSTGVCLIQRLSVRLAASGATASAPRQVAAATWSCRTRTVSLQSRL